MTSIVKAWFREATSSYYCKVDGKQVRLAGKEEGEAKADLEHAKLVIQANAQSAEGKGNNEDRPCKELATMYLEYVKTKFSKEHQRGVLIHVNEFMLHHGDKPTNELMPHHLDGLIDTHATWKTNTKRRMSVTVKAMFNWLLNREYVSRNPFQTAKNYPVQYRQEDAVMKREDYANLYDASPAWLQDALTVLRETGMRPGTLVKLTAQDIKPEQGYIETIHHKMFHKTQKPILIPITQRVTDILTRLMTQHPTTTLFFNGQGRPLLSMMIYHAMNRAAKRAGLGKTYPYQLRHMLGHEALMEWHLPVQEVAAILGHSGIGLVERCYGHHASKAKTIASKLEGRF